MPSRNESTTLVCFRLVSTKVNWLHPYSAALASACSCRLVKSSASHRVGVGLSRAKSSFDLWRTRVLEKVEWMRHHQHSSVDFIADLPRQTKKNLLSSEEAMKRWIESAEYAERRRARPSRNHREGETRANVSKRVGSQARTLASYTVRELGTMYDIEWSISQERLQAGDPELDG